MTHRIELTFVGDAPPDEMARARILASPHVTQAITNLSEALVEAGLAHEVVARSIRPPAKRPRPALAAAGLEHAAE